MNSDVVLSCGCTENVEALVTKCEDYLDKDTFELFRDLSRDSNDEGLDRYVKEVLEVRPEVIGENVRAMNWAVENVRELRAKKDHVMEVLRRQPATAKERWGLELEHITRWEPEVEGDFDLYSQESSGQIQGSNGKFFESVFFRSRIAQDSCATRGPKLPVFRCLIFV